LAWCDDGLGVVVAEGPPWRGPTTEEWVARIAAPILRDGETLPLVKPFPTPLEEGGVSDGADALPGVHRPVAQPSEGEWRELYGR
jgi:hypothetical protein